MRKIYDTRFTTYIFDKKEAGLDTEGFLTKKDISKPADFYVIFKERKTKEVIGKARIDVDEEARKKFYKKKFYDNFKTSKIIFYDFRNDLTEKQRKQCLNHLTQWCTNRTTDTIYLNIDNVPEFNNTAKWFSYEAIMESTEYKRSATNTKAIWIITDIIILLCAISGDIISFFN